MISVQTKWLVIGGFVFFLVLGVAGYTGYRLWVESVTAKTEKKISDNQTEAAIANGKDAVETLSNRSTTETHTYKELRDITNVIRNDKSPSREYDDTLYRASIDWMCKQSANSLDPKCVQQPTP